MVVDEVVEERAELRAGRLRRRLGRVLHEHVEVELGHEPGADRLEHADHLRLGAEAPDVALELGAVAADRVLEQPQLVAQGVALGRRAAVAVVAVGQQARADTGRDGRQPVGHPRIDRDGRGHHDDERVAVAQRAAEAQHRPVGRGTARDSRAAAGAAEGQPPGDLLDERLVRAVGGVVPAHPAQGGIAVGVDEGVTQTAYDRVGRRRQPRGRLRGVAEVRGRPDTLGESETVQAVGHS